MTLGPQNSSATASLRNLVRSCAKAAAASMRNSSSGCLLLNALRATPQPFRLRQQRGLRAKYRCLQPQLASQCARAIALIPS